MPVRSFTRAVVPAVVLLGSLLLTACEPAFDAMNITYPRSLCSIGRPLKVVDGNVSSADGRKGLSVRGTPVSADLDGDGRTEHTVILSCWGVGANESWTSRIVTVRAEDEGARADLVAEVPGRWGEHARDPLRLSLSGSTLTVSGDEYRPGDTGATGPTGRFTARFRFSDGRWRAV